MMAGDLSFPVLNLLGSFLPWRPPVVMADLSLSNSLGSFLPWSPLLRLQQTSFSLFLNSILLCTLKLSAREIFFHVRQETRLLLSSVLNSLKLSWCRDLGQLQCDMELLEFDSSQQPTIFPDGEQVDCSLQLVIFRNPCSPPLVTLSEKLGSCKLVKCS